MQYRNDLPVFVARWGDETLVYNKASGDTHCFSGVPEKLILACLSGQVCGVEDLQRYVPDSEPAFDEDKNYIQNFLQQLLKLDLIVPLS